MTDEKGKTYVCTWCGETNEYGWSDDEAKAEAEANFGHVSIEDMSIVCDDCYQKMTKACPIQ